MRNIVEASNELHSLVKFKKVEGMDFSLKTRSTSIILSTHVLGLPLGDPPIYYCIKPCLVWI